MQKISWTLFITFMTCCMGCNTLYKNYHIPTNAFDAGRMGKNVSQLASDSFQGRRPFTEGENRTLDYLQNQFRLTGLEPGNGNSFRQQVPLVSITSIVSPNLLVESEKGSYYLKGPEDYVLWSNRMDPVTELKSVDLVFAGYGIVAPEYNWDDYTGIDVRNKIVMVLANEPGFDGSSPSIFKGDTMTYYARWTYKLEEATRQGAIGCLLIHSFKSTGQAYRLIQNGWNATRLQLDGHSSNKEQCAVAGWLSEQAANRLIASAGVDSSLLLRAGNNGFRTKQLGVRLSAMIYATTSHNRSHNVIGKITGSKWPEEYIIYTAHWDHFGIGRPDEKGDSIYNGAHDNASGVAGLIELAHAFKSQSKPPERTIVFLALTAEEQGLLGSEWYVQNPVFPVNKTLANINIDGLNPFEKTVDMIIVGQPQSSLEDDLKEIASKIGRSAAYDGSPSSGYYFRSDQFNFAKAGIPAIYAGSGSDVVGKGIEYGKRWKDEYGKNYYHRPSDEYDPATWTMEAAIEDLKLLYLLGKHVASKKSWPQWKENSEFRLIRQPYTPNP